MTPREKAALIKQIDELGALRERLSAVKTAESAASDALRQAMADAGVDDLAGKEFAAQLAERRSLKLDPVQFKALAGAKVFAECLKVDVKIARKHFTETELESAGEVATSKELRISRKPAIGKKGSRQ